MSATRRAAPIRWLRHDPAIAPLLVIWEVTQACQLACVHCRAEAIPGRDSAELSRGEGFALIDEVAAFGKPSPILVFTGGDPFERDDLEDLVAYAAACGVRVGVSPSATPSVTPERLRAIRTAGATVISLSLDGSTAAIHDGFRGVDGVFDRTLAAWDQAHEAGLKVQINTTVSRHNLDDLVGVLAAVHARRAMIWSVFFLVPTGRGSQLSVLTAAEMEDASHLLYDAASVVSLKTTEGPSYRRVAIQRRILEDEGVDHVEALGLGEDYRRWRAQLADLCAARGLAPARTLTPRRPPIDVRAGSGFIFVSHIGEVYPSGFLPLRVGNVRAQPLTEIYRSSAVLRRLRDPDELTGRCGACEFRSACGGSRARAAAVQGDPFAEEPWCAYVPGSFGRGEAVTRMMAGAPPHGS